MAFFLLGLFLENHTPSKHVHGSLSLSLSHTFFFFLVSLAKTGDWVTFSSEQADLARETLNAAFLIVCLSSPRFTTLMLNSLISGSY